MKPSPSSVQVVLAFFALALTGCTFGLVHTREANYVRLYLRSVADTYAASNDGYDAFEAFLRPMKINPEIVATLAVGASGHHVEIVSTEGVFPKWSDGTALYLIGTGRIEQFESRDWHVYTIPDTLRSEYDRYSKGTVRVSADRSTVILDLTPSPPYRDPGYANLSGRYPIDEVIRSANQPPQRNAGSRPSSDVPPASETPSSLGPRG